MSSLKITTFRFSEISHTLDGEREFLEAISEFRRFESEEPDKLQKDGFHMPNVGDVVLRKVTGIDFITLSDGAADGIIEVHQV